MLESTHAAQLPIFRTVLLLAGLLAIGFLAAFALFDSHAERAPAVAPTASTAAQKGAGVPSAGIWAPAPPIPRKLRLRAIRTAGSSSR